MAGISGRGATQNRVSERFRLPDRVDDPDWLDTRSLIEEGTPRRQRTNVTIDHAKSIISRNTSPDVGFDRSINAYRGCEHGCIYCFARPTHAWLDLSPGLDFETQLFAKPDAADLLRTALSAPSYRVAPLAIGTNTDPYQPIERDWRLTRQIIEVMAETGHPLIITTKSDRIIRDIDVLAEMAKRQLISVAISVTSLDPALSRILEPRAPRPDKRLAAVAALMAAGVPTQVNVSPIIPAITDMYMESVLSAASEAGAYRASYIPVRLPYEVAGLFRDWLDTHFPDRAAKVMHIIQDMRGGKDNDPNFGTRMRGTGVWAELMRVRFRRATRALGLDGPHSPLSSAHFVPPERNGQMRLFD